MPIATLFPATLSSSDRNAIRDSLSVIRIRQLQRLLDFQGANASEAVRGAPHQLLGQYLGVITRLMTAEPATALRHIDNWPLAHYVSRVLHHGLEPGNAAAYLLPDLLFDEACMHPAMSGLRFTIPLVSGTLPVFQRGGCLRFRNIDRGSRAIQVTTAQSTVDFADPETGKLLGRVPAPMRSCEPWNNGVIRFDRYPVSREWNRPIVEDCPQALAEDDDQADRSSSSPRSEHCQLYSLSVSLGCAHEELARTWPAIVDWIAELVPMFFDLTPGHYDAAIRGSGSFGPGGPIYLTKVARHKLHAEDLVHELQHQRFQLTVDADEWFGEWSNNDAAYVSPYRRDPRPIRGIHLGLHAFSAVNHLRLLRHSRSPMSEADRYEFAKTHLENEFALRTIVRYDTLRGPGRPFYAGMIDTLRQQSRALGDLLPADLTLSAAREVSRHAESVGTRLRNSAVEHAPLLTADFDRLRQELVS